VRAAFHQGGLFGIYLIGAGIERFLIEFIRRNDDAFAGLTTAQLFSLGLVAAGGALIWWVVSREGRLRLEPGDTQRAAGA
jgi:phosphatidylglycerol:prolipoprotein diacylglycerol transferase